MKYLKKNKPDVTVALTAARGLRSVGILTLRSIREQLRPELHAQLYCSNFPVVYDGLPYFGAEGMGGALFSDENEYHIPTVDFHVCAKERLLLVEGYQADFQAQYSVASAVVDVCKELGVKRIIALLAHALPGAIRYAATGRGLLKGRAKYVGSAFGYSSLILGVARVEGIEGVGIFGKTEPCNENPEDPDYLAAAELLREVSSYVDVSLDPSGLMNRVKVQKEIERSEVSTYIW